MIFGFLVSVILSSVISPTGGMVMSFSSAVFDTHLTNVFLFLFLVMFYSSFCATYSNIVIVLIIN